MVLANWVLLEHPGVFSVVSSGQPLCAQTVVFTSGLCILAICIVASMASRWIAAAGLMLVFLLRPVTTSGMVAGRFCGWTPAHHDYDETILTPMWLFVVFVGFIVLGLSMGVPCQLCNESPTKNVCGQITFLSTSWTFLFVTGVFLALLGGNLD